MIADNYHGGRYDCFEWKMNKLKEMWCQRRFVCGDIIVPVDVGIQPSDRC
jgi:hypothetical protein